MIAAHLNAYPDKKHEEDRTQLGFSYLDVVVQCQLKCFRISYQTSNYYPGSRGSHLGPMSHTPVFPTPLIYPRAHAHRVKTSTWCAHRREFMGSFFLVCTAGDCRQQPRCAWSWSTHTSISRGVEQGTHISREVVLVTHISGCVQLSEGVGVTQEFGQLVKERCLENFSCVLVLCKHVLLSFICCIANIDSEYKLITH